MALEEGKEERGMFLGSLVLTERAFLHVQEIVSIRKSAPEIELYSYYLVVDGEEVWGYDRDPDHEPPDHGHRGAGHEMWDSGPRTFEEVAHEAWSAVSELTGVGR